MRIEVTFGPFDSIFRKTRLNYTIRQKTECYNASEESSQLLLAEFQKMLLYVKGFTGNKADISILKTWFRKSELNNMIFISEKGYYFKSNAEKLTKNGISLSCRSSQVIRESIALQSKFYSRLIFYMAIRTRTPFMLINPITLQLYYRVYNRIKKK